MAGAGFVWCDYEEFCLAAIFVVADQDCAACGGCLFGVVTILAGLWEHTKFFEMAGFAFL